MKTIKIALVMLLVAAMMPIVSCQPKSKAEQKAEREEEAKESIIGYWEIVEGGDDENNGYSRKMILHFTEDNMCDKIVLEAVSPVDYSYQEGYIDSRSTYKIHGNKLKAFGADEPFTIKDDELKFGDNATFKRVSEDDMKKMCKNTKWDGEEPYMYGK